MIFFFASTLCVFFGAMECVDLQMVRRHTHVVCLINFASTIAFVLQCTAEAEIGKKKSSHDAIVDRKKISAEQNKQTKFVATREIVVINTKRSSEIMLGKSITMKEKQQAKGTQ